MLDTLMTITDSFFSMTVMALPFFIIAILASSYIETKFTFSSVAKFLNSGKLSLLFAAVIGGLLPGCACATVPIAKTLKAKGLRLPALSTFMMVSPLLGPHTIILTYGLLGLKFTIGRILAAMIGGLGLGMIMHVLDKKNIVQLPQDLTPVKSCCKTLQDDQPHNHTPSFLKNALETSISLGKYFLIGIFIAASISTLVPPYWMTIAKNNPILAYAMVIVIGIPIYVCEGEEVPIVKAFLDIQFPVGPAFSLMMAAVGTCIPTLMMAQKVLGKKTIAIYLAYWVVVTPIFGLIFSLFTQ